MRHDPAQCVFYGEAEPQFSAEDGQMCTCSYQPFSEYCSKVHHNTDLHELLLGDSTMGRLKETIATDCALVRDRAGPTQSVKGKLVVINEGTLHRLYLPFARESDVHVRITVDGHNQSRALQLAERVASISHFKSILSARLNQMLKLHNDTADVIWVYMSNDVICPDAYISKYRSSWRSLIQQLDLDTVDEVARRRDTDRTAGLAFTLDYYGSSFAADLAARFVSQAFPGFHLLKMRASNYPAVCLLTSVADGRHFEEDERVYYVLKARLLLHLIAGRL